MLKTVVQMERVFEPWLPGHDNYMDLKFSLLRHAVCCLISNSILFAVQAEGGLAWCIRTVNGLYMVAAIFRYRGRKRLLKTTDAERKEMCGADEELQDGQRDLSGIRTRLIKDSGLVVVYAILCWLAVIVIPPFFFA